MNYSRSKIAGVFIAILGFVFCTTTASAYVSAQLSYSTSTWFGVPYGNGTTHRTSIGTGIRPFNSVKYFAGSTATSTAIFTYFECPSVPDLATLSGCTSLFSQARDIKGTAFRAMGTTTQVVPDLGSFGVLQMGAYYDVKVYGIDGASSTMDTWQQTGGGTPVTNYFTPYFEIVDTFEEGVTISTTQYQTDSALCTALDFGCYFSNALRWAFYPSPSAFDKFATLKDDIKDHAPFGYFTSAVVTISGLSTTSTSTFELAESAPIMDLVFTPIRTGLTWIIIFACLFWLYKRLTDIQI